MSTQKSNKAARSTCSVCHMMYDRKDMTQGTNFENTGYSNGGGVSTGRKRKLKNGKTTRDTRVSASHRKYYRKQKYWICAPCSEEQHAKHLERLAAIEASRGPIFKGVRGLFRIIGKVITSYIPSIAFTYLMGFIVFAIPMGIASFVMDVLTNYQKPYPPSEMWVRFLSWPFEVMWNAVSHGNNFYLYKHHLMGGYYPQTSPIMQTEHIIIGFVTPIVLLFTIRLITSGKLTRI